MRMLLVGGGKVGSYLARELRDAGHVVSVIESNPKRSRDLTDESGVLVFEGDGTDVGLLRSADVDRADWLLAVTGRDDSNLVACQLGLTLGAAQVLARLNDPKNRPTFEALDIPTVGVTDLMARVISREVEVTDLSRVAVLGDGQISVVERVVPEGFPDTPLSDLDFPAPSILVTVIRGDQVTVPGAGTVLQAGDRVMAVTTGENERAFCDAFDDHSALVREPPGDDG